LYALACDAFNAQLDLFLRLGHAGGQSLQPLITFDDGHRSDYEYALPALADRRIVASFFITAGWTGREPGYMDWQQLRSLDQAGQRIGAHGWSHTLLTHCTPTELDRELGDARRILEDKLGCPVTSMSLPGGRYNRRVLAACQAAGYTEIYTSIPRAEPSHSSLLIGRVNVRAGMSLAELEALLDRNGTALPQVGRRYRVKQAARALLGDQIYARLWARLNRRGPAEQAGPDGFGAA
jgi:peptidoglycan/xylan/chitin deacetylase (PgdA/CDA1 family)